MILKMNSSILIIALLIFGAMQAANCRPTEEMDNSLEPRRNSAPFEAQDFVKVTKAPPPRIVQNLGSSVEIVCEVMGSPPPTVKWINDRSPFNELDDYESNALSEASSSAIVRVRSVLVIDHVINTERTFTCIGQSGAKFVSASTVVYASADQKNENLSELLAITNKPLSGPRKPRITYSHTLHIDVVGSNVILPCQVVGRPRPEIFWMNSDGLIIEQNPRFKILPSGSLLITDIKWEDMGAYKCLARNSLGKDSADTFIYPALKENK